MPNPAEDGLCQVFDRITASDGGRMITGARDNNIRVNFVTGNIYFQGSSHLSEVQGGNYGFHTQPIRSVSLASSEVIDDPHSDDFKNTVNDLSLRELDKDMNDNRFRSDDKVETWVEESEVHDFAVVEDAHQDYLSSINPRRGQQISATTTDAWNSNKRLQPRLCPELEAPAIEIISSITNSRRRCTVMMRADMSQENWISDRVLNDCGIMCVRPTNRITLQFPRKLLISKGMVNVIWYREKKFKSRSTIFHVTTTTLFDVLFGGKFLDSDDNFVLER